MRTPKQIPGFGLYYGSKDPEVRRLMEYVYARNPDYDQPNSLSADDVLEAAKLCQISYDENPKMAGWKSISSDNVELPDGYEPNGKFVNKNAVAFVQEKEVNGTKTLAIAFKGTDMLSAKDWMENIIHINNHYTHMRPLMDAIDKYINQNDIQRVIVTGHSLGGAMAAIYMQEHVAGRRGNKNVKYEGVTFGSPGAVFHPALQDCRILSIRHQADLVPKACKIKLSYKPIGRVLEIQEEQSKRFSGIQSGVNAHKMAEYTKSILELKDNGTLTNVLGEKTHIEIKNKRNPDGSCVSEWNKNDSIGVPIITTPLDIYKNPKLAAIAHDAKRRFEMMRASSDEQSQKSYDKGMRP